jgi:hypothetical protein
MRLDRIFFLKSIVAVGLSLGSVLPASAYFEKGGDTGIGARPLGMGGAFCTIADDSNAIYYNPAGLIQVFQPEISGMGAAMLNGKSILSNLAYVQPFSDQLVWALSTVQQFDTEGSKNHESIYEGSFAAPLSVDKTISVGFNVKFYMADSSVMPEMKTTGMGADMSFLYHIPLVFRYGKQINLCLMAEDLDTTLHEENDVKLPTRIRGGMSYEFTDDLVAAFEMDSFNDPSSAATKHTVPHVGIEGWFFENRLGLRTGFSGYQTLPGVFTAGISYRSRLWGIDYAYMGHPENLGSSHRISANWRFGHSFFGKARSFIPEGVNAYVEGDIITLRWSGSHTLDLGGYNVYFSKQSGGEYVRINQRPVKSNYYAIKGLERNTRYFFTVTSVTSARPAVESQYSRETVATTTAAPGAPVVVESQMEKEGLVDAAHIANMAGFGDPNTLHLKGYNVYLSEVSGGRFEKINAQPLSNVSTYLVRKLKVGQKYYFKYSSVGIDDSESRLSDEVTAMALPASSLQTSASSVPTPADAKLPVIK